MRLPFVIRFRPRLLLLLNKTQPLESGVERLRCMDKRVRADQSDVRKKFKVEEHASEKTLRFHPMLDWPPRMVYAYLKEYDIPRHPLELKGYQSIGCEPCTRPCTLHTEVRQGRWYGLKKTECGLHTQLITAA